MQIYILYYCTDYFNDWDFIAGVFTDADEMLKRKKELEELFKDGSGANIYYHTYDANKFIPPIVMDLLDEEVQR